MGPMVGTGLLYADTQETQNYFKAIQVKWSEF